MLFLGVISMCLIFLGFIQKSRVRLHMFAMAGSLGLCIYSIYIGDLVFIILNLILSITNLTQITRGE